MVPWDVKIPNPLGCRREVVKRYSVLTERSILSRQCGVNDMSATQGDRCVIIFDCLGRTSSESNYRSVRRKSVRLVGKCDSHIVPGRVPIVAEGIDETIHNEVAANLGWGFNGVGEFLNARKAAYDGGP